MKKAYILYLLFLIVLSSFVSAGHVVKDSQIVANAEVGSYPYNTDWVYAYGCFNASATYNVGNISMRLKKISTPTGNIWISLYNGTVSGAEWMPIDYSHPISKSDTEIDVSTISTSATDYKFLFLDKPQLNSGELYCIIFNSTMTPSDANGINIAKDNVGEKGMGNSANATTWNSVWADDGIYFLAYNVSILPEVDSTLPSSFNFTNNASTLTKINGVVNWSINLSDETALSFYIFAHNDSGTLRNVSNGTLSGTSTFVNKTITITQARGNYICGQYWFNDSTDNVNQTLLTEVGACFTVQNSVSTTPNVTYPVNSINYSNIPYINYSSSDPDGDVISYTIYINNTLNITTTVNVTQWNASDGFYNLTVTANDSSDYSANSSVIYFRLDTTAPSWSGSETNASLMRINGNATFNITVTDNGVGLSYYIFSWNGTGEWNNNTNGTISGNSVKLVINKSTNLSQGNTIGYIWYANDSLNQWNNSVLRTFTVVNTLPIIAITSPIDDDHNNVNISAVFTPNDADNDSVSCSLYINGSINATNSSVDLGVLTTIISNISEDGVYEWYINCTDGVDYTNTSSRTYTLDTINPIITIFSPTNRSGYNSNFWINFSGKDTNLYIINYTVWNASNGSIQSNQSLTTTETYLDLNDTLDISALNLADGTYYINFSISDSHTGEDISNLKKGKKGESEFLINDTDLNLEFNMIVYFVEKDDKLTDTPGTLKSYLEFNSDNTRITFGINFTNIKPETKPVFRIKTTGTNIEILDTDYRGHLIWYPYGADFEGVLLVNEIECNYTVEVTRVDDNEVEVKIIPSENLAGNDIVEFKSDTIFGLNIVERMYEIYIDTVEPSFSNNQTNATATTPRYNEVVQINITIADSVELDGYLFAHNNTGTMQNGTYRDISGTSHIVIENITIANLVRGDIFGWQVWVNDTTGNVNVSNIYTLEIKNTVPTIPNIIYPVNNTNYSNIPYINYSSSDVDGDTITYNIYINGTLNISTIVNITSWNASDGYYNLTVTANDSSEFSANSSIIYFGLDSVNPKLVIISPVDGYTSSSATIDIIYNISDNNPYKCKFYWNNVNVLNDSIASSGQDSFSYGTQQTSGSGTWYINCTDLANNYNASTPRTINLNVVIGVDGGGGGGTPIVIIKYNITPRTIDLEIERGKTLTSSFIISNLDTTSLNINIIEPPKIDVINKQFVIMPGKNTTVDFRVTADITSGFSTDIVVEITKGRSKKTELVKINATFVDEIEKVPIPLVFEFNATIENIKEAIDKSVTKMRNFIDKIKEMLIGANIIAFFTSVKFFIIVLALVIIIVIILWQLDKRRQG